MEMFSHVIVEIQIIQQGNNCLRNGSNIWEVNSELEGEVKIAQYAQIHFLEHHYVGEIDTTLKVWAFPKYPSIGGRHVETWHGHHIVASLQNMWVKGFLRNNM